MRAGLALLVVLSPACAARRGDPAAGGLRAAALIEGVPHVEQRPDFCGEACAAMYLAKLGHPVTQDQVFGLSGTDPLLGRGAWAVELKRALGRLGFDVGPVWYRVERKDAARALDERFGELHADLVAGVPSIVCMHFDEAPDTTEHFRLIRGYDPRADEVIYHEPAEAGGAYRRMKRARFLALWPLPVDGETVMVIRLRLAGRQVVDPPAAGGISDADIARHMMALAGRIPPGFTVRLARPFVVIGNEDPATVTLRAERIVGWTIGMLRRDFFDRDPTEILDVWLLAGDDDYRRYAKQLFDDEPETPYGYYSPKDKALIMNIATGGGTLVHEVVHPFVRANCPSCPPWFNEGLGSLFEQPAERDGHIVGLTNWRLRGLQHTIRGGALPAIETVAAMDDGAFYRHDDGDNYGQSRYLLYWVQERGLLPKFVRAMQARPASDPSGYQAFKQIVGESDMRAFQKKWEAWVLELKFGDR